MSFIVLKPWALHPAQILFCFVFFPLSPAALHITFNSLPLWPDSYPVLRVALHFHPHSPGNGAGGVESGSSFRICFTFLSPCGPKLGARVD